MWEIILTALLLLYVSRVCWYDLKQIFLHTTSFKNFLSIALKFWGAALAPFIGLLLLRFRLHGPRARILHLFAAYLLYTLVVGIFFRNQWSYVISDTFKLLFFPAGYLAAAVLNNRVNVERVAARLAWAIFIFMVIRFVLFKIYFDLPSGFIYGGVTEIFAYAWFLSLALSAPTARMRIRPLVMCLTLLALIVLGQKTTTLGAAFIVTTFLVWKVARFHNLLVIGFCGICALLAGVILFGDSLPGQFQNSTQFSRLSKLDINHKIGENSSRREEIDTIRYDMGQQGVTGPIFGRGSGATYQVLTPHEFTKSTTKHSVHFTPAAMILRGGIFGVILYATLIWIVVGVCLRPVTPTNPMPAVFAVYALCAGIGSLFLFGMVDDILFGYAIGSLTRNPANKPAP